MPLVRRVATPPLEKVKVIIWLDLEVGRIWEQNADADADVVTCSVAHVSRVLLTALLSG